MIELEMLQYISKKRGAQEILHKRFEDVATALQYAYRWSNYPLANGWCVRVGDVGDYIWSSNYQSPW